MKLTEARKRFGLLAMVVGLGISASNATFAENKDDEYLNDALTFLRFNYVIQDRQVKSQGPFAATMPGIGDLEANLGRFRSSVDVLTYLLEQRPHLAQQFVLLHHSESLQLASPEHPRIILFDGGMAYAFSEDPMNREDHVEVMQVDPITKAASFHDLAFRNGQGTLSRNAKSCLACHGEVPRPIWAPYDFWPNAYSGSIGMPNTRQEAEAYGKLRVLQPESRLLSKLNLPEKLEIPFEGNTAFTQYVYQLGFSQWVERNFKGHPLYGFEYALLGQTNGCGGQSPTQAQVWQTLQGFFQPGESEPFREVFDRIYADLRQERAIMKTYQIGLLNQFYPAAKFDFVMDHDRLAGDIGLVAGLRWILEMARLNGSNLGLSHVGSDSYLSTPGFFLMDLQTTMFALNPQFFDGLEITQPEFTGASWAVLNCDQLRKLSVPRTRQWPTTIHWRGPLVVKDDRPVVARCAKCHAEGADPLAPAIPFSDTRKLAQLIRDPKVRLGEKMSRRIRDRGKDQMPPEQPLTNSEIESLEAFIQGLR